jgi:ribosomal protein L7/L12
MTKKGICKSCNSLIKDLKICQSCGKSDPLGIENEVRSLLSKGRKIEAVKKVVEMSGLGLRVSKDYVDSLEI